MLSLSGFDHLTIKDFTDFVIPILFRRFVSRFIAVLLQQLPAAQRAATSFNGIDDHETAFVDSTRTLTNRILQSFRSCLSVVYSSSTLRVIFVVYSQC